ncbi:MAG: hypothetical protein GX796_02915, partial [Clostridiaceae bacterium]|nr:hypothetical protein [Clostridiaceae bacterium]
MKKRLLSLLLALTIVLTASVFSFAESESPTTLEAPQNVNVYYDQDIMLRWTIPQSIVNRMENEEYDGTLYYCIDWKLNDGPWHFNVPKVNSNTYDWAKDTDVNIFGHLGGLSSDENNIQVVFFTHWSFGYDDDSLIDIAKIKYTFRIRFAFEAYDFEEGDDFIMSPYSNEVSIGGPNQVQPPKAIDAPTNLKAELKYKEDDKPYFALNWTNP